jgi:hypothetical protein
LKWVEVVSPESNTWAETWMTRSVQTQEDLRENMGKYGFWHISRSWVTKDPACWGNRKGMNVVGHSEQ